MGENSLQEDIEILEQINSGVLYFAKDEDYEKYSKAIKHILSDYKRVLKENEELEEYYKEQNEVNAKFIPIQKVKDKIEEIQKDKDNKYYDMFLEARDIEYMIEVLDELLEKGE